MRVLLLISAAVLTLVACNLPTQPILSTRTLSFDVSSRLFASPTATNPGLVGPGLTSIRVTISVTTSSGTPATLTPQTFTSSQLPSGATYGNFTMSVTGLLKSIQVVGLSGTKTIVSTDLTGVSQSEASLYGGWQRFENLKDFEIDWSGTTTPGLLQVVPCPRPSATVLADSGVQLLGQGTTDLASSLKSRQVAIQVQPAEYDADGSLTYDVYYAVASVDPSVAYNPAVFANTYLSHPWTPQWSYAEVAGGGGKQIGPTVYVMKKYSGGPYTAGKLDAQGHAAVLVDLTSDASATVGKYLLYSVVLHRAGLSVPTDVGVIPIN